MNKIYITMSLIIVLLFTACGGNGDGSFHNGETEA